ncbi:hypothetical protein [Rhizobium leguminosarum]|uniref:hypothetical protein n=1 Tax=Rhizobium leguminosarum TaxID=384 RepID=UPI0014419B9A|nr:hypothetical protein [Rhizobium leguminosarum]MBY5427855.1 hypothetical protein [Rhizobium leguminosarum]
MRGEHERMIVCQLGDRGQDFLRLPAGCDGAIDETGECQMKGILASNETVRVVIWDIGRVYFVHVMNMMCAQKCVKLTN